MPVEQEKRETPEIDLNEAGRFVVEEVMPESMELLRRYFRSGKFSYDTKGALDIVTQADTENEDFIREKLISRYPQTNFLGEERSAGHYEEYRNVDNIWVIDPLDGTVNFFRGQENFAVSIALVSKGKPKLAVVGLPSKGEIYWAQSDKEGVFSLRMDPLTVSSVSNLKEASFRCDWVYDPDTRRKLAQLIGVVGPRVRQILTGGSAVSDIVDVALGKVDMYFNPGLKPWDEAAACMIVEKSGGRITTVQGEDWNVFEPNLVITNGVLHDELLQIIQNSGLFSS